MSYREAMDSMKHPRYAEATEYLTMHVDGLVVALRFPKQQENAAAKQHIEDALLMADGLKNDEKPA